MQTGDIVTAFSRLFVCLTVSMSVYYTMMCRSGYVYHQTFLASDRPLFRIITTFPVGSSWFSLVSERMRDVKKN